MTELAAAYEDGMVGFYEVPYSLQDLQSLRDHLSGRESRIAFAVGDFLKQRTDKEYVLFWVDWAEKIKADPDLPERQFEMPDVNEKQDGTRTRFTTLPNII